jgi:hypothetical protein
VIETAEGGKVVVTSGQDCKAQMLAYREQAKKAMENLINRLSVARTSCNREVFVYSEMQPPEFSGSPQLCPHLYLFIFSLHARKKMRCASNTGFSRSLIPESATPVANELFGQLS